MGIKGATKEPRVWYDLLVYDRRPLDRGERCALSSRDSSGRGVSSCASAVCVLTLHAQVASAAASFNTSLTSDLFFFAGGGGGGGVCPMPTRDRIL